MAINHTTLLLQARLRSILAKIIDEQTRAMAGAWVASWDYLLPDLEAAVNELLADNSTGRVTLATVRKSKRIAAAMELIGEQLDGLAEQADATISRDILTTVQQAADLHEKVIRSQLPGARGDITRLNPDALTTIVERSAKQITKLTKPLSPEAMKVVRGELVRGIAIGANPKATAQRIITRTEGGFNGGLTRAMTISGTETMDAYRKTAWKQDQANADIIAAWTWLADLGPRTCPACWGMNGTVHDVSEQGPSGHQNCRCSRQPTTKSWADLGFEGIVEPPPLTVDAETAFRAMPRADQLEVMGKSRLELLDSGKISWGDLAQVQQNPGWRDSVVPVPVRDLVKAA